MLLLQDKIVSIVGKDLMPDWICLCPKVYYMGNKPYGLLAKLVKDDIIYIASTTISPSEPFTVGMLRDIIKVYKTDNICLITDDEDYQDKIMDTLSRYEFTFEFNENNVLFSTHYKGR